MANGTWGDPNVYTKAETDAAIAQSAATLQITDTVLANNNIIAYKIGNVVTLTQVSSGGVPSTGITLPASLKPKNGNIMFIGKAYYNGDKWNQGFLIDPYGVLTARSNDNNTAITVTWTSWCVTYIVA